MYSRFFIIKGILPWPWIFLFNVTEKCWFKLFASGCLLPSCSSSFYGSVFPSCRSLWAREETAWIPQFSAKTRLLSPSFKASLNQRSLQTTFVNRSIRSVLFFLSSSLCSLRLLLLVSRSLPSISAPKVATLTPQSQLSIAAFCCLLQLFCSLLFPVLWWHNHVTSSHKPPQTIKAFYVVSQPHERTIRALFWMLIVFFY